MGFTLSLTPKPNKSRITTAASSSSAASSEHWGMGLLLVFFPEDDTNHHHYSSSSNHLFSSSPLSTRIRRSNSTLISTKAQSTISICALFVFLTLLLFTLSTFEPSTSTTSVNSGPRRFLSQKSPPTMSTSTTTTTTNRNSSFSFLRMWSSQPGYNKRRKQASPFALQGMGALYRRGTRAVNDLLICHVAEDTTKDDFRLFLRVLYRSGFTSKSDVAFLYASSSSSSKFESVIEQENDSFLKLIQHYRETNNTNRVNSGVFGFDVTQFLKSGNKDMGEPLWGKRIRGNYSNSTEDQEQAESTQLSYGSVVGFEVNELDPENSLAGFLDHVPMSLRRWACYPMLLGRVRRNFKHVLLVDVKELVLLGDPLVRVRTQSPETVHISTKQESVSSKHTKRNSDKTQPHYQVNSAILMGGARGIRRLSAATLTEIVRASMQHKKKSSITESGILSQLVANEHILKNINLIKSIESIPEASSLSESRSSNPAVATVPRGNGNHDADYYYSIIMKQICSCEAVVNSSVYENC